MERRRKPLKARKRDGEQQRCKHGGGEIKTKYFFVVPQRNRAPPTVQPRRTVQSGSLTERNRRVREAWWW